jgi:hypothetical protein
MKRFFSTLTSLVLLASASGCCCDWCNWGCCNPCRSSCGAGGGCAPTYGAPVTSGSYVSPANPAVGSAPTTYYGAPVSTASVTPVESLGTW